MTFQCAAAAMTVQHSDMCRMRRPAPFGHDYATCGHGCIGCGHDYGVCGHGCIGCGHDYGVCGHGYAGKSCAKVWAWLTNWCTTPPRRGSPRSPWTPRTTATQLSAPLRAQLAASLDRAIDDDTVRVSCSTTPVRSLCAGMDLKEAKGAHGRPARRQRLPRPAAAAVDEPEAGDRRTCGPARAGGVGLVAAADIAVAVEDATFAFTEVVSVSYRP